MQGDIEKATYRGVKDSFATINAEWVLPDPLRTTAQRHCFPCHALTLPY